MPIGQIQSNSTLVGSLVFDTPSLNNTGISSRQIKPLDLAGQSVRSSSSTPSKSENLLGGAEGASNTHTGLSTEKIQTLEAVAKIGKHLTAGAPEELSAPQGEKSVNLAPAAQSYNFIGKLTSQQSAAGTILNAVA
ncbi:MAG: hypothetical protein V4507_16505 [Verrucomicrobiota bacterium]